MEPGIDIRRRSDGSIDTSHYEAIARADRLATVRRHMGAGLASMGRLGSWLAHVGTEFRGTVGLSPQTDSARRASGMQPTRTITKVTTAKGA
jgi:hypothetical protein